jgi:hypothetical protein
MQNFCHLALKLAERKFNFFNINMGLKQSNCCAAGHKDFDAGKSNSRAIGRDGP